MAAVFASECGGLKKGKAGIPECVGEKRLSALCLEDKTWFVSLTAPQPVATLSCEEGISGTWWNCSTDPTGRPLKPSGADLRCRVSDVVRLHARPRLSNRGLRDPSPLSKPRSDRPFCFLRSAVRRCARSQPARRRPLHLRVALRGWRCPARSSTLRPARCDGPRATRRKAPIRWCWSHRFPAPPTSCPWSSRSPARRCTGPSAAAARRVMGSRSPCCRHCS